MANSDDVQDRNIRALEQSVRLLHDDLRELKGRVDTMAISATTLFSRCVELERMVTVRLASSLGNGPTKRD